VEGKAAFDAEFRVNRPDGQVRWVRTKAAVQLGPDGRPRLLLGVTMDITQPRVLEKEILEISEREQRRIGQDLHDGLGQQLAGIQFRCNALELQLASKSLPEAAAAARIGGLLIGALSQAGDLARGLLPVESVADGLAAAIKELCSQMVRLFGVACVCECDPRALVYDNEAAVHLYRIAQEGMSNAVKHGRAKRIHITLAANGDDVLLTIRDEGIGIPEASWRNKGMGLHIMQYRARLIGGLLEIRPLPEGGTLLTCSYRNIRIPGSANASAVPANS
jgi:signal transduction histidine kinase